MASFSDLDPGLLAVLAAAAATLVIALVAARRSAVRAHGARQEAERREAKERERADLAERELRAERERAAPDARVERIVLDALSRGVRDLAGSASRDEVGGAVGRAVASALAPRQWMVFLSADAEGREFVVAASGGEPGSRAWKRGARLSSQSGKLGLAVRRRATLDRRDFEAEPPIVREQVLRTEPSDFETDLVVPVLVGDRVAGVVVVGGADVGLAIARTCAEVLASFASVVLRGLSARERAERMANHDSLTGVGNRSWFNATAAEELYRIRHASGRASLVMFGIQHFSEYTRRHGVQAADKLVRGVAQVIRPLVADGQFLARWGADEFVVLLPDVDLPAAWAFAAKARRAVARVDWPHAADHPGGRITVCAGLAGFPVSGNGLEEMIAAAAATLADARANGADTTGSVVVEPGAVEAIATLAANAKAAAVVAEKAAAAAAARSADPALAAAGAPAPREPGPGPVSG